MRAGTRAMSSCRPRVGRSHGARGAVGNVAVVAAALVLAGCARAAPPAAPAPAAPAPAAPRAAASARAVPVREVPNDIRWSRASAEHRAIFLEVYRAAGRSLDSLALGAAPGTWAVILDGDETTLDNSAYQLRRAALDSGYTLASWNAWVRERSAPALPGAAAFTARVREMGGRVVIVTNREEIVCPETRENLRAVGIAADLVLCQAPGVGDKNPRFQAVARGTAAPGVPPLRVLMWVGDNIEDFPGMTQAAAASDPALANVGRSWWVLPNPMYGSWQRAP